MSPRSPEIPEIPEIHYRVAAPVLGHFPGHHRSRRGDSGFEFRGHANLLDAPDPRRLDLHASLRDPFGAWVVRVYSQRKSIPVVVVADLSASMGFEGAQRKLDVLAALVESLAWSAWRTGDSFGFVGCDEGVRTDFLQPPTRSRGVGNPLAQRLRGLAPTGRSAGGLLQAARHLGRQRALVFLASDFHLPLPQVEQALGSLAMHEVLPVVLWDPAEFGLGVAHDTTREATHGAARGESPVATHGLVRVVDPESGRQRLLWWRPALRAQWQRQHAARREALAGLFRAHRLRPLFIEGRFDADAVTRHFHT